MRRVIYKAFFSAVVVAGLFVGMVKGQEVRHKWVAKMKNRHEEKKAEKTAEQPSEVLLDEIELATYHS